jgi:sortase A
MLTTDNGDYKYAVSSKRILDQSEESAYDLTQEKEELILYTCYPFGQLSGERNQRFYVYCEPVSVEEMNRTGGDENETM